MIVTVLGFSKNHKNYFKSFPLFCKIQQALWSKQFQIHYWRERQLVSMSQNDHLDGPMLHYWLYHSFESSSVTRLIAKRQRVRKYRAWEMPRKSRKICLPEIVALYLWHTWRNMRHILMCLQVRFYQNAFFEYFHRPLPNLMPDILVQFLVRLFVRFFESTFRLFSVRFFHFESMAIP